MGAIFSHPKTWEASGHVASFNDPLVEDKKTHIRYRADHLIEEKLGVETSKMSFEEMQKILDDNKIKSPDGNELTKLKSFNLMVEAELGSTDGNKIKAYLRGETCQVIFLQYLNVLQSMRMKIPFGIAQIGKAFRNEITTKDFIYRTREFDQMELESSPNQKMQKNGMPTGKNLCLIGLSKNLACLGIDSDIEIFPKKKCLTMQKYRKISSFSRLQENGLNYLRLIIVGIGI